MAFALENQRGYVEGPMGLTYNEALANTAKMNSAFSTFGWESAKQDGCLAATAKQYPQWPPKANSFVYPESTKKPVDIITANYEAAVGAGNEYMPPNKPFLESQAVIANQNAPNYCAMPLSMRPKGAQGEQKPFEDPVQAMLSSDDEMKAAMQHANDLINGVSSNGFAASLPNTKVVQPSPTPASNQKKTSSPSTNTSSPASNMMVCTDTMGMCMMNTVQGILYDLRYWDQLPTQSDDSISKFLYVLTRDDRPFYLFAWIIVVALIYMAYQRLSRG